LEVSLAEDSELHQKLLGYFQSSLDHPADISFRTNAVNDFEFYEGTMWSSDEIKELQDRGQAPIVENEIKPIIDKLEGQYVSQKTRIGFVGRNFPQDEQLGDTLSDLALYVQQQTDYEYEEKDSFKDGTKCGFGVLEAAIDQNGYKPKILLRHEDCLSIYPDPFSKRYDWSDAEFISRAKWVSKVTVNSKYPDKSELIAGALNTDLITNSIPTFKKENYYDNKNERVRLIETWYKTYEKRKYAYTEGGLQDVSKIAKKSLKGLQVVEKTVMKMKMAVWCVGGVLESGDSPYDHDMFPFIPFFVDRKKSGEPVGIVRALKDPNSEINKRRSKALHQMSTNQALFEQNAVADKDILRTEIARPDGLLEYKKGYKFELNNNIDLAQTQMALLQESKGAIKRIAGQDLGFAQEVRSNSQLQRKQQMEDIVVVPVFDNLRRTRKIVAKHIYELIKQFYDEEMVFNVTDDQKKAKMVTVDQTMMQKIKESECDIIVEEMPETTTIHQEQFQLITDMLKSMNLPPSLSMSLMPIMVRMSQLRDKEEILKAFENIGKPPPDQPKISMNIDYINLSAGERLAFAEMMQSETLMKAIQTMPSEPPYMVKEKAGIEKINIKTQGDLQKTQMGKEDPEVAIQQKSAEMMMKEEEHRQKLVQSNQQHLQKMKQTEDSGRQKMVQGAMNSAQKIEFNRREAQNKIMNKNNGK
jgi:hypothetical protein